MLQGQSCGVARPASLHAMTRGFVLLAITALPLCLAGCKTVSLDDITGSIAQPDTTLPSAPEDVRRYTQAWEKRYDARPNDPTAALAYARGLRALGQYEQAVAVVQKIALKNPEDLEVLGAYGKALAEAGRLMEAAEVLKQAHTPDRPNWSILSAQGSVADQMGDPRSAQGYYREALKINPGEPSVLSNLGPVPRLSKTARRRRERLAGRRTTIQKPMRASVKIWRWSSRCKASSPKLKRFRAGCAPGTGGGQCGDHSPDDLPIEHLARHSEDSETAKVRAANQRPRDRLDAGGGESGEPEIKDRSS